MAAARPALVLSLLLSLPQDPAPPALRLPGDVRPLRYALDLTIVPDREAFDGIVRIDAVVERPTRVVWLNAHRAHDVAGEPRRPARPA